MAKLWTVICIWLLTFLWLAIGAIVAFNLNWQRYHRFDSPVQHIKPGLDEEYKVIYPLTLSAIIIEFIVVVLITILTTTERSVLWRKKSPVIGDM